MRIEWERDWGKPADESDSRKSQNHTFELLRRYAREHYPILEKIRKREREVEKLATDYKAREIDALENHSRLSSGPPMTLESLHKQVCENIGADSEKAKLIRAAMAWWEKQDEINDLKQKAGRFSPYSIYPSRGGIDPWDHTEEYEARSSLEWTIRYVMDGNGIWERNDDWDKDYEFREELEIFLDDIASERCHIRENFDSFHLYENIGRYLENPSWHSPLITDFLLVDLIDTNLIDLERTYHFDIFPANLADQIHNFIIPPQFSPKSEESNKRYIRRGSLVFGILFVIMSVVRNYMTVQHKSWWWVFDKVEGPWQLELINTLIEIGLFGTCSIVIWSFLKLYLPLKKRAAYKGLEKLARKFTKIRFEITSETYHAKRLIEKLQKLEEQDIVIHSLTYALLELRAKQ